MFRLVQALRHGANRAPCPDENRSSANEGSGRRTQIEVLESSWSAVIAADKLPGDNEQFNLGPAGASINATAAPAEVVHVLT